jgi:hypothetical protein
MKIFKFLYKSLFVIFCSAFMFNFATQVTFAEEDDCKDWIRLNTNVPFVGNCIHTKEGSADSVTPINAFPKLIGALMNLLMTVILIMSLLMIVYAGILLTMSWADSSKYNEGVNKLQKVAIWMALLWASWVILKLINPNFF